METTAYVTDGSGGMRLQRRALPEPGAGDVLLEIRASSLNFRDLPFVRGDERRGPSRDRVPCSDAAAIVREVGSDVTEFRPGDRVMPTILPRWIDGPLRPEGFLGAFASQARDGLLAQEAVVEATALVRVPDYLTDVEAASLPCAALTAWHALVEIGAIGVGGTVVIESTGGVALFALQIAGAMGLRPIVVSRSDAKLARAREMGAWQTLNSVEHPAWDEEVLAMTAGRGADLVLDMGLENGLPRSCRATAFEGTVAILGVVHGWNTRLDIGPVMNKNLRVRGVETGSRAMLERMLRFFELHRLRPAIAEVFAFAEAEMALEALGRSPFGKIVVEHRQG